MLDAAAVWERLAALPLTIEAVNFTTVRLPLPAMERVTTVITLRGLGETGLGEDVTYEAGDHLRLLNEEPEVIATGTWTLGSFTAWVAEHDLFPDRPPEREVARRYRRWAWESAALDLALRQADTDLATVLDRSPAPVTFVSSARVGSPPSLEPLQALLMAVPGLRFKLDAGEDWDESFVAELAKLAHVACVDFKAYYSGTIVDVDLSPEQTLAIALALPHATLEDVAPGRAMELVARADAERLSWDAPIHSTADVDALPLRPHRMNVKPSRVGSIQALLELYEQLETLGVEMYGGGQFELSVGRGQIILLASLMHPHAANDTAPVAFHAFEPGDALPSSPLPAPTALRGFRWPDDE